MLTFEAVLGGLPGALKLFSLLFVPAFGLFIRRKWRLAAASREEVRRLVILAAEEAAKAEIEAAEDYYVRSDYEPSPPSSFASGSKVKSMCAVCYKPTTTRCSRCKSVKYCSGKCQIIHWRQGHKEECRPPAPDPRSKDEASSSNLGIRKDDSLSSSESSLRREDDYSVHNHKERNVSSDSRTPSSVNISKDIPKVESIEDPLVTASSSDSSSISTSSSSSTFTVSSETIFDASFEGSPSSRERIAVTSDATYSTKNINGEQKPNRSSSNASSETYSSDGGILLPKLSEVSDSRTKKAEYQSGYSERPSSGDVDKRKSWPSSVSVSTVDDHFSASTDSSKVENYSKEFTIQKHHGHDTKPLTVSRSKTISSLPHVLKESPIYKSIQSKGDSLKSRSSSSWDFETERNSSNHQLRSREMGSTSFRVSANEYSSASCGPSVLDSTASKLTSYPAANARLSGMTNSISKAVQHLKVSKISRNENAGKPNSSMQLSYDTFFKLYNEKIEMRPFGLLNCGNSCYANVVLQCLAFTRPLSSYLLQGFHSQLCSKSGWCFTCELESLVLRAKKGESVLSPASIMSRVHNIGAHLGHGREEDAHEFLRSAVDTMQSAPFKTRDADSPIRYVTEAAFMQLIFGGYIRSKIKCMNCQCKSVRNERMMDLTVGIPGDVRTLQEALSRFTATEVLDGENKYKCSRCKSYQKAKKRLKVLEAPNILTIALKRFQSGKFGKLNKPVALPETLNLSEYMSSSSKNSDKSPVYQLYAVVVHLDIMNAAFSGHYVCYVRSTGGKWFKIDDSMVKPVELDKVLSKTAYMLFYARRSPRNVAAHSEGRPKSRAGDDLPAAPPARQDHKKTAASSESSDGSSSLFSSSPSDGSSFTTESTRYSSSSADDFDDSGYQTLIYEHHHDGGVPTSTTFLDSDPGRDFRKLTLHCASSGDTCRSAPPTRF